MDTESPPPPVESDLPITSPEERNFAMFCHLSALVGYIGVPFGSILGPLILWLVKRQEMPLVDEQGKEALNFNITVAIAALICIPLVFVVIGIFLLIALVVAHIVLTIMAAIKVNGGQSYRYPFTLRLVN